MENEIDGGNIVFRQRNFFEIKEIDGYNIVFRQKNINNIYKAIVENSGILSEIENVDVGTGKKPIVFYNNELSKRINNEGIPIVRNKNAYGYQTMTANDKLII